MKTKTKILSKTQTSATDPSAKRQRDGTLKFAVQKPPSDVVGPVLVSLGETSARNCQEWSVYEGNEGDILHGESSKMVYQGREGDGEGVSYLLALYDPVAQQLDLTPTPFYRLSAKVKALEQLDRKTPQVVTTRTALGEAFGSKKAKSDIKARDRNRLEGGDIQQVAEVLHGAIEHDEDEDVAMSLDPSAAPISRLIPRPNLEARTSKEGFRLGDIIGGEEMDALPVKWFIGLDSHQSRTEALPLKNALFVSTRLESEFSKPKISKSRLRKILYFVILMKFYALGKRIGGRAKIAQELSLGKEPLDSSIVDGLIAKFTERSREDRIVMTTQMQTKILSYLAVLALMIDDYSTNVTQMANDLGMSNKRLHEIFKSVGCRIEALTPGERETSGLSPLEAKNQRRAVLTLPFQFPSPRKARG